MNLFLRVTPAVAASILGAVLSTVAQAGPILSQDVKVVDPSHLYLKALQANEELVIDHVGPLGYEVYGPLGLRDYLRAQKISFVENEQVSSRIAADYPSPEEIVVKEQDLAKQYPNLITLTEIGKSVEGHALVFAKLTAPADQGSTMSDRPEFKYIANMHGNEIVGREMMIKFIEDLASNYGKDQRITQILNTTQVYILPSMNPDGAVHKTRYNKHGADLNRSFPDFTTNDNQNTTANREPEVEAVMKFQALHHFKLSANYHGGSQVVNYPWDTTPDPFPLDNLVKKLSLDYASRAPYIYKSTSFEHGITNGYAWYEVDGGMQDWSYHWYNDLQLTLEISNDKWPPYSKIVSFYQQNRDSMLALIEDIHQF